MKSFQTPHTIANEVRLKRTQHKGPFLIVEGPTDSRFYRRFVDFRHCPLIPAFNKENVVGAVTLLGQENFPGILGIVDSDFDALMGNPLPNAGIIRGDTSHDLETMLVRSPALDAILHEFASPQKLDSFEGRVQAPFRAWILESAQCLGYLRWHSAKTGVNLCFDGLRFPHFINLQTLELDRQAMVTEIKNRSRNWDISDADLIEVAWPQGRNDDPWHVCCGHDMADLIAVALRRAIGSNQQFAAEEVASALRLAYSEADFVNSELCARIRDWERAAGFRILR